MKKSEAEKYSSSSKAAIESKARISIRWGRVKLPFDSQVKSKTRKSLSGWFLCTTILKNSQGANCLILHS